MKTFYELIVAINHDPVIGIDQYIPWKNKNNMQHFCETTAGHILIMGRKTFDSLPNSRPLNNRIHVVLTNSPDKYDALYSDNDSVFFTRFDRLDDLMKCIWAIYPEKRAFVCGGEETYRILLPRCSKLHIMHDISDIQQHVTKFPALINILSQFRKTDAIYWDDSCRKVVYESVETPI